MVSIEDADVPLAWIENIATFFHISVEESIRRVAAYHPRMMADAWRERRPRTPEDIRAFYSATDLYIFELTKWNYSPDCDAKWNAIHTIAEMFSAPDYRRVLDYGCGIGSYAMDLAARGYDVTVADVPGKTLDFVKHCAARRAVPLTVQEITETALDGPTARSTS